MAVLHIAAGFLILAACGGETRSEEAAPSSSATVPRQSQPDSTPTSGATSTIARASNGGLCADVIAAELEETGDQVFRVSATVSSADTGEEKYADQWRVLAPDGTVLGVRILTHPHVDEQPFTRSLTGVEIGVDVESITIEARDSVEGYCGDAVTVDVP